MVRWCDGGLAGPLVDAISGLESEVLTIQWPTGIQPAQLSDFESQARRLRYRALGKACLANSISSLFLAHHDDDQAETVLMRLANGLVGTSLRGMQASAGIPECWGMYGVHESGNREPPAAMQGVQTLRLGAVQSTGAIGSPANAVETESGGIRIHRPLLEFSKNRLEATCKHFRTQWVEDLTNRDPTMTMRNSVRQLLHDQRLPVALRKASLLRLAKRALQRLTARSGSMPQFVRNRCEILTFDLRSGLLVIKLQGFGLQSIPRSPICDQEESMKEEQYQKRLLVQRLIKLVTPQEDVPLQDLGKAVSMLFPASSETDTHRSKGSCKSRNTLTIGKAWLQRVNGALYTSNMHRRSINPPNEDVSNQRAIWTVSRQPHDARETLPTIIFPPSLTPETSRMISDTVATTRNYDQSSGWSSWQLWDGRYWIRLLNHTNEEVEIHPMQKEDLAIFRTKLTSKRQAAFNKKLRYAAPDRVRWTLPVIAMKQGPIHAIPTLQEVVDDVAVDLKWEIRYKKIDLEPWRCTLDEKTINSTTLIAKNESD